MLRSDRREYPRIPTDEPVIVTVLGPNSSKRTGRVRDISAKGVRLVLDEAIPISIPLRIDVFDTMLLGEACYCTLIDQEYHAGIRLEHFVANVQELAGQLQAC